MSERIPIQQVVYDKNTFSKVVDTQFRELNNSQPVSQEVTVEEFFRLYDELFFDIPKEGDINSHVYILNREAEYAGVKFEDDTDVQVLLQEITDLRQQLVNIESINSKLSTQVIEDTTISLDEDIQEILSTNNT